MYNVLRCAVPLYLSVLPLIHRMRKRSLLIAFLFFVTVVHTEISEQIRLSDDISNDFVGNCPEQAAETLGEKIIMAMISQEDRPEF
jgi:hypothetical protein